MRFRGGERNSIAKNVVSHAVADLRYGSIWLHANIVMGVIGIDPLNMAFLPPGLPLSAIRYSIGVTGVVDQSLRLADEVGVEVRNL